MSDYKEYKIKIIFGRSNSSSSDDDPKINNNNTYTKFIDNDSTFFNKYCDDYKKLHLNLI